MALLPVLLAADASHEIYEVPGYAACGTCGERTAPLHPEDLIRLPRGSRLFLMPQRYPLAWDIAQARVTALKGHHAVAAFLPPGYTLLSTAAYQPERGARLLPLFAYAPVAWYRGAFHVPAIRVDRRRVHDTGDVDRRRLKREVTARTKTGNRLIRHLADCALTNGCPNAINFFLGRHECPLPTSPRCNARCLGCISFQPEGSCPATQPRLTFTPTAQEVAEVALRHLDRVPDGIVSFGQGCEGEPLAAFPVVHEAITLIRRVTRRGTIHMNTNASRPDAVAALCRAGLDSLRVSLNSARAEFYERYYRPRGYGFDDVRRSIRAAKRLGRSVALNYLVMPGFTDRADEFAALRRLIRSTGVDMVQWRNLNYDPRQYVLSMKVRDDSRLLGMREVMAGLGKEFPRLQQGYFNVARRRRVVHQEGQ